MFPTVRFLDKETGFDTSDMKAEAVFSRIARNASCRRQKLPELCQYGTHERVTELTEG